MRSALFTTIAVLVSLVLPTTAKAEIANGGFEDDFTGWEAIGDYRVETSNFGSEPVEGNSQAFLSTAFDEVINVDASGNVIVGGNAVPATFISNYAEVESLEGFLSTSSFLGDNSLNSIATAQPIEGSAVKQTFAAEAGEIVSFSWNFLTNESTGATAIDDFTYPNFNDFAFAVVQSDSGSDFFNLADTVSNFGNSSTSFEQETGTNSFAYKVPSSGNYTLAIGVVDVGEPTRTSGLLIDRVETVPEADSTIGVVSLLFLGTGWTVIKSRKLKVES